MYTFLKREKTPLDKGFTNLLKRCILVLKLHTFTRFQEKSHYIKKERALRQQHSFRFS